MSRSYACLFALLLLFPVLAHAQKSTIVKPPALADILSEHVKEMPSPVVTPSAMPAASDAPIPPLDPHKFPVLAKIKAHDGDVNYDYLGQRFGLDLWVISGPGVMQIVYTLPNNQGAIVGGSLVDAEGRDVSSVMQQAFIDKNPKRAEEMIAAVQRGAAQTATVNADQTVSIADDKKDPTATGEEATATEKAAETAPALSPTDKLWAQLDKSGHIDFGDNKDLPMVYAVLDPFQADSKNLWTKLQGLSDAGRARVAVMPLATTDMKQVPIIAKLLGSEDRKAAWLSIVKDGTVPISTKPQDPGGVLALKNNLDVMQSLNLRQVPVLFYKNKASDKLRVLSGQPKDWAAFETELGAVTASDKTSNE